MSKAKDSKQNQPNVVAKLMGLEALSREEFNLSVEKVQRKYYYSHQQLQMEDSFVDKEMIHEDFVYNKGVHKTWMQQSQRTSHDEDFVDDVEKMALIQQKFMEAKFMSTDERLRNSKQFKDALEVLSSNSDLLIRLLDSQNLYQLQSTPPDETKMRITLLKPFAVDNDKSSGKEKRKKKNDELIKNVVPVQSTRIVVLKPSSGKTHKDDDDDDVAESRKVAKEIITQQVYESLYLPSVISNCYPGDESSFSKSCIGYKDGKNFTDLESMSPRRHYSWDHHINDYYESSSFYYSALSLGGATCSPESSVCIEAKKRLHERWNMMKSNSNNYPQEQMHHVRRKSTTLGEMLSLFKIKKYVTSSEAEISTNEEDHQESRDSVSFSHSVKQEMGIHDFHENLLPMSNNETDACKSQGSKVLTKSKSMGSLFRGKVSNFLFSRKKKKSTTKLKDESQCSVTETTSHCSVNSDRVLKDDDLSQSFNSNGFQDCSVPALCESFGKTSSDSVTNRKQQAIITIEPGLIVSKTEISSENQDQPSPISVLDTPFEDDSHHDPLDCMKSDHHGSLVPLKSNLIDKSPPIESIARTLSWGGGSCADSSSLDTKSEQQEWLILVEKLLSASGFHDDDDDQVVVHHNSFNTRWHSLESPLDPSLRDKYANLSDMDHHHHDHHHLHLSESKRRKMRSNQNLVFDCVNAALLDYGPPEKYFFIKGKVKSCGEGHIMIPQFQEGNAARTLTCHFFLDHIVEKIMKELIMGSGGVMRCVLEGDDCGDSNSMVVENFVRKEVVGIRWVELMDLEIDILEREIESELIQELVEDAVVDFIGRA